MLSLTSLIFFYNLDKRIRMKTALRLECETKISKLLKLLKIISDCPKVAWEQKKSNLMDSALKVPVSIFER